jgi:hypothetical protein
VTTALRALAASAVALAIVTGGAAGHQGASRPPATGQCLVPGTNKTLDHLYGPNILSAIGYQRHRQGDIAFAVRTDHRFYGYRPDHQEWSASVLKAMLLVAYLDRPDVAGRSLHNSERALLDPMITRSDNNAADQMDQIVGDDGLRALAARVGMTHFVPTHPIWGESLITPRDQTKFFLHIDSFIPPIHRWYAMHLLASVIPPQRWGIGEVAPRGWKLYFKGGWGSGTGLIDNQVALLRRGCARVSIAVLTMYDGSHDNGKQTLKVIFEKLLKGLPLAHHRRYRRGSAPA